MATRDEVFTSKYLKAADLKGRGHVVEIEECWQETLKSKEGKESNKTILRFVGKTKALVLNMTNWDSVAEITGEGDTISWPGHAIEIYPTKTTMGSERVDCIRIRQPNGEAAEAKAAAPKITKVVPAKARPSHEDDDMDDEIPF